MHTDLMARRRALSVVYGRFLEADRAWNTAITQMNSWFPSNARPLHGTIGNPGSPIRKLYEQRERAISQLDVAVLKLKVARHRLARRRRSEVRVIKLLSAP